MDLICLGTCALTDGFADVWSKDPSKEEQFRSSPTLFTGKPREISVFFSRDAHSPALSAFVQAYRWNDERDDSKVEKAAFVRDSIPSHQKLLHWVERQIQLDQGNDFPSAIHRFLLAYSRDGTGLPKVCCAWPRGFTAAPSDDEQ